MKQEKIILKKDEVITLFGDNNSINMRFYDFTSETEIEITQYGTEEKPLTNVRINKEFLMCSGWCQNYTIEKVGE